MKTYVLDASALVRYLSNGAGAEKVHALIQKAANREARLLISVINWGEVLYSLARIAGLEQARMDLRAMDSFIETVETDESSAETASVVRLQFKLGYADCFAAVLAMRMQATLVTSDPDFSRLGKELKVLSLSNSPKRA